MMFALFFILAQPINQKIEMQRKIIFPSYSEIEKKINEDQKKEYENKLKSINQKIGKLKEKLKYDRGHKELIKNLINQYKKEHIYEKPNFNEYENLKVIPASQIPKYADSLNEHLEDSDEEKNNYEAHLKFRKKVL